jgi:hypothetical protein
MKKQEGNDSFAITFFTAAKLKKEGFKGRSLPLSSRSRSRFRGFRTLTMEFVGPLQACYRGFALTPTTPELWRWSECKIK